MAEDANQSWHVNVNVQGNCNDDYDYNIDVIGTELSEEEYINEV